MTAFPLARALGAVALLLALMLDAHAESPKGQAPGPPEQSPKQKTTTSIFSKTDGIVHWQSCLETEGPERENVEVASSHTGMGFHAAALAVIADRLAQPTGSWRRYAKRA